MRRLIIALRDLTQPDWRSTPPPEYVSSGVMEVPDFVDQPAALELRAVVDRVYETLEAARKAGSQAFLADEQLAYHFTAWGGVQLKRLPKYLDATDPELAIAWRRSFRRIRDRTHGMFDKSWRFVPERSWLRRHDGIARKVPWHIDADAAAVAGSGKEAFNVWLPLESVGRDLPSLEVIRGSHHAMRALPLLKAPNLYRDDAFVGDKGPASVPCLDLGDALVFDQYTLHRTQEAGSADTVRTACEFRFAR